MDYILKGLSPGAVNSLGIFSDVNREVNIAEGHSRLDKLLLDEAIFNTDVFQLSGKILGTLVKTSVKKEHKDDVMYMCYTTNKLGKIKKIDFPDTLDHLINLADVTEVYVVKINKGIHTVWRLDTTDREYLNIEKGNTYYVDNDKYSTGSVKSVIVEKYRNGVVLCEDGSLYPEHLLFSSYQKVIQARQS